jgi:small subunit ribosomal protein S6
MVCNEGPFFQRLLVLSVRRKGLRASPERDTFCSDFSKKEEFYVSSDLSVMEEQREYELVYILQSGLDDEGVRAFNDRLNQVIESHTGVVTTTEIWGRRTLAYPIGKNFDGVYILERFQLLPAGVEEVERFLRFNENVIRHLVIRLGE